MLKFEQKKRGCVCSPEEIEAVQRATGLPEALAMLLCERGINTPVEAKRFLHPGPEQLHDPLLLPDMEAGVTRIKAAVENNEKITVFCDYDADGTCGGSALYLHLKGMGANVGIMTPNRHREGYGLSLEAVEAIVAGGTTLIITVDCGITNVAEVALARSLGADVIITDHHECGELPDTRYIINPKRQDSVYPCPHLAGCGVAFKLIQALSSLAEAALYIDLIAVGTVTDIVPLLGENRAIAHMGIKKLKTDPSAGLKSLADAAGIELSKISSFGVSFGLGPRINAAGRMDTAELALSILGADKQTDELTLNARKLCELNERRRKEVELIEAAADDMVKQKSYMNDSAILLADERWNPGVIGIAAAKIAERYTRPCVLFGGNGGSLIGSARSIEGVNIYEALAAFADRYEKFGGHAQAAGLTIAPPVLEDLRLEVCAYIDTHYDESVFIPKKYYDIALQVGDITRDFTKSLDMLEPYGQCNEKPLIGVLGADITEMKFVGNGKKPHLKFTMRQAKRSIDAISFFFRDAHSFSSKTCDFLCEAGINDYSGAPQLVAREIAMRYDSSLIEGFLDANSAVMAQSFMGEVLSLAGGQREGMSELEFILKLTGEIAKSRFGLCIEAATEPAFKRLVGIKAVEDALLRGELSLFDERAYSADNCIACGVPAGHDRVLRAGAGGFFDEELLKAYKNEALRYFASREELLRVYLSIESVGAIDAGELGKQAGGYRKAAFMQRVLGELKLIETDKSGRIHAIKAPKKQLRESEAFRSFEDFIRGLQKA